MAESLALFIPDSNFEENYPTKIAPGFAALRSSQMTIVPWIEPNFWDNVKSEKFCEAFCKELFARLLELTAPPPKTKKEAIQPTSTPEIEACLISLLHLIITYKRAFGTELWTGPYEKLVCVGITSISYTMLHISKILNAKDISIKTVLDNITGKYDHKLLLSTVPIFNLIGLIRQVRSNPEIIALVFQAFKTRLESLNVISEASALLNIMRIFVMVFPGIKKEILESILEPLNASLIYPIPVSSLGADLGILIKRELEYPGAAFFDLLRSVGESNLATNGSVPLLFDQKVKYLPNLLHFRQMTELNLETMLFNFGNFYLIEKFHDRMRSPKHVFKLIEMLDFTEKATDKIAKKFKIAVEKKDKEANKEGDEEPKPEEESKKPDEEEKPEEDKKKVDHYDTKNLSPPLVKLQPIKLSVNFDLNPALVNDFVDGTKFFMSTTSTIFNTNVMQPILKFANEQAEKEMFIHKLAVCGGDFFLNNVVLSLVSSLSTKEKELSQLTHILYLIPLDNSSPSELSRYISAHDDIYSRFVNNVYYTASTMAPVLNESSTASFPSIITNQPSETNVWYANPSPSVVLQFAIQHYLLFANYTCSCYVWSAVLEYNDNLITVPFITSLHVGTQFSSGNFVDQDEKKIKPKKFSIETDISKTPRVVDVTSIVLWNVNVEERIKPNDRMLLLETVNDPTKPDVKIYKDQLGEKATRVPVMSATIKSAEKTPLPFKVFIDQRVFGPVKSVRIQPMRPLVGYEKQFRIKIATFVPFE